MLVAVTLIFCCDLIIVGMALLESLVHYLVHSMARSLGPQPQGSSKSSRGGNLPFLMFNDYSMRIYPTSSLGCIDVAGDLNLISSIFRSNYRLCPLLHRCVLELRPRLQAFSTKIPVIYSANEVTFPPLLRMSLNSKHPTANVLTRLTV